MACQRSITPSSESKSPSRYQKSNTVPARHTNTNSAYFDDTSSGSSPDSVRYHHRRRPRYSSPDLVPVSTQSIHKLVTEHVLISARNANIPVLLRSHQKKNTIGRHRQAQDDPDYEPQAQNQQRVKKPKAKTPEQLEAEKRRMLVRKAELEEDPLLDASRMCHDRVWCILCKKYIQIDSRRQFYATLWYKHRGKRHSDVSLKRSDMNVQAGMDVEMNDVCAGVTKPAGRLGPIDFPFTVPLIDDAFASSILADMYSKAQGLCLLSFVAAALG